MCLYEGGIGMQKRLTLAVLIMCSFFLFTEMDIQAAPKTMPDGTVFDADFYAETYPDVAKAVGNDEVAKKLGLTPCSKCWK